MTGDAERRAVEILRVPPCPAGPANLPRGNTACLHKPFESPTRICPGPSRPADPSRGRCGQTTTQSEPGRDPSAVTGQPLATRATSAPDWAGNSGEPSESSRVGRGPLRVIRPGRRPKCWQVIAASQAEGSAARAGCRRLLCQAAVLVLQLPPAIPVKLTVNRPSSARPTTTRNSPNARSQPQSEISTKPGAVQYRLHRAGDAPRTLRATPPGIRQAGFGPCSSYDAGLGVLGGRSAPRSGRCPCWYPLRPVRLARPRGRGGRRPHAAARTRGEGTDGNVQPLCYGCHLIKTAEDFPLRSNLY